VYNTMFDSQMKSTIKLIVYFQKRSVYWFLAEKISLPSSECEMATDIKTRST